MIIFIVIFGPPLSTHAETTDSLPSQLTLAYHRPKEQPITQWLTLMYTEAFRRLGIQLIVSILPSPRAGTYSNSGEVDGELARISDYNSKFPNLIKVDEPNFWVKFSAFATDPLIKITNWESLKKGHYQIGYLRGGKKVAEQLFKTIPADQLTAVHTLEQAHNMLIFGRVDIVVTFDIPMQSYLNLQDYQYKDDTTGHNQNIYNISDLEEITSHAWLYQSHRKLAPQLSNVLREMKAEGLFQKYSEQVGFPSGLLKW